jgi:uncharacterized protein
LEAHEVELEGELSAGDLDIETHDEVVEVGGPLYYKLEAQKIENALLVQGSLRLQLDCQCVRCLKAFQFQLELDPWTLHLPLSGEDAAPVSNDCVDLTPYIREDILLEFPQHPLCERECRGLPKTSVGRPKSAKNADAVGSPAWTELNKLKL